MNIDEKAYQPFSQSAGSLQKAGKEDTLICCIAAWKQKADIIWCISMSVTTYFLDSEKLLLASVWKRPAKKKLWYLLGKTLVHY